MVIRPWTWTLDSVRTLDLTVRTLDLNYGLRTLQYRRSDTVSKGKQRKGKARYAVGPGSVVREYATTGAIEEVIESPTLTS